MAYIAEDEFGMLEEVAQGLVQSAQRHGGSLHHQTHLGFSETVMLTNAPIEVSYSNPGEMSVFDNFPNHNVQLENPYTSITMSVTSSYRHAVSESAPGTSPPKRSNVGRKPLKGPDGVCRYSSRRATVERRDRINSRERDRMHQLCDAFERLRQVLPGKRFKQGPQQRQKLSKIGTLLMAQNYIRSLEEILSQPWEEEEPCTASAADAAACQNQLMTGGEYMAAGDDCCAAVEAGMGLYAEDMTTMQYSFCADLESTTLAQNCSSQPVHQIQYQCL